MKLTVKQQKFADEYLKTGNATLSAERAGYSKKTAGAMGHENLNKPYIKEYIDKRLNKTGGNNIATAEEVLQYLTDVMTGKEKEKKYTYKNGKQFVAEEVPAMKERTKAAELLGKRHSLFTDRKEVNLKVEKPLEEWLDD